MCVKSKTSSIIIESTYIHLSALVDVGPYFGDGLSGWNMNFSLSNYVLHSDAKFASKGGLKSAAS